MVLAEGDVLRFLSLVHILQWVLYIKGKEQHFEDNDSVSWF